MTSERLLAAIVLLVSVSSFAADPEKPRDAKLARIASPPEGFVQMFVTGVLTTEGGPAVILQDAKEERLLPIWIGFSEAHAIQLRLERRRFPRPLTHDLLEQIMQDLGGELVEIHVDDLKGNTFVGTLVVRKGDELRRFDARPSDSIALAIGSQAPIYVSAAVLERVEREKKSSEEESDPEPPPLPSGIKTL